MKNFFFHLSSIYRKFFKFQKKIQETERKNPRLCRNFQRRLYRSSSIQLLIINEILQIQLKRPRKTSLCDRLPLPLQRAHEHTTGQQLDPRRRAQRTALRPRRGPPGRGHARGAEQTATGFRLEPIPVRFQEYRSSLGQSTGAAGFSDQYPIIFSKLISKEYRYFLTRQIFNILWVFALSPILDNKKKDQIILTGLKDSQIYPTIYTFLKKPFIQYIAISQFSNFFNRKNKYWILSNLLIEKKFFLSWLKLDQKSTILGNSSFFFSLGLKDKTMALASASEELTLQSENNPWQLQFLTTKKKMDPLSLKTTLENFVNLSFSDFLHMLEFINPNILPLFSATQDHCLQHFSVARRWNSFVRSSKLGALRAPCFAQTNAYIARFGRKPSCPPVGRGPFTACRRECRPEAGTRQRRSGLKALAGRPIGQVALSLHKLNNIDLKKGMNARTSISHQLSVPKNILPSLFPNSRFLYFDLIKQIGFLNQSCFKFARKIQQHPIPFFSKHLMEYNGLILLALKKKRALRFSHKSLNYYAQIHGLKIKFIKFYSLNQGLHFLGWFFQKKNHSFEGFISHKNISNHQKELKHCLKTSENKPTDKIIYELNQKIIRWQKYYNCSIQFSKTCSQLDRKSKLNDDLFWFIWRWIKKRHKNRGSKWLYTRYWKKSTSRRWIFSAHQHTLIFYIR